MERTSGLRGVDELGIPAGLSLPGSGVRRKIMLDDGGCVGGAVGSNPDDAAVRVTRDPPALLVEDAVVVAAQQDEVVQVGTAAPGPVNDVMGVDPATPTAARETTAAVSCPELSQ